jgi:ribonuclease BN (tRNA processing enzyme)
MLKRRDFLKLAAAGGAASLSMNVAALAQTPAKSRTRIVFLGTKGGPRIGLGRSNPANLIMVNNTPIVLDCGEGVSHQLVAAKVPLQSIKYILLSHLHSDHDLEYGNLAYNAWATGLKTPIHSFGPKGTEAMTKAYWEVNKFDIETRIADEGRPDLRKLLIAKDINADGVVLKTDDVTVTAFRTPHPPIMDNFAYKFETAEGTIVFSSDTEYNPKLGEFAKGCDVLVHEALYVPGIDGIMKKVTNGASLRKHLLAAHTTTEDIGRVAAIAKPKLLVLSHLVPGDNDSITDDQWLEGVRKHFDGKAIVAKDLMEVTLPV